MDVEKREMPEGVEEQTGTCIYCGQTMMLNTVGQASQEQLDKWATERCTCEQAKKAQDRVKVTRRTEDNIRLLFREKHPEIEDIMLKALSYVEDEITYKITVDTGTGIKGILSRTSKGTIKVEINASTKKAMEG